MAEVVGTAYVRIRAVTTKLAADIKDGVDKGARDANPDIERAGQTVGDTMGAQVKSTLASSVTEALTDSKIVDTARAVGSSAGSQFSRGARDALNNDSNGIASGVTTPLRSNRFFSTVRGIGSRVGDIFTTSFSNTFDKKFQRNNPLVKLINGLQKVKFTGIGTLITLAAPIVIGALKVVSYYLVGIVAQLGYIATASVGAGAALAGVFLGALPGLVLLRAALKVTGPMLDAYNARIQVWKDLWSDLARITQAEFLPRLGDAFQILSEGFIPMLRDYAGQVGVIAGETARFAAAALTSEKNGGRWRRFLVLSKYILEDLGAAFVYVADSLAPLFEALSFIGAQFSDTVRIWAKDWNEMIQAAANDGSLVERLQLWYDRAVLFFGALWDFTVGIWNALKIGADAAEGSFDTFASFAERWRTFTETPDGQNKIRTFFDSALEVMKEVNLLLKDIIDLLFTPLVEGDTSNLIGGIQLLRTEILPAVVELMESLTGSFDNGVLTDLAVALSEFFTALSSAGFIATYLGIVTEAIKGINTVLESPLGPGAAALIGFLWGLSTLTKLPLIGPALTLIAKGISAITLALAGAIFVPAGTAVTWATVFQGIGNSIKFLLAGGLNLISGIFETIALRGLYAFDAIKLFFSFIADNLAVTLFRVVGALAEGFSALGTAIAGAFTLPVAAVLAAIVAAVAALYFLVPGVRDFIDDLWDSMNNLFNLIKDFLTGEIGFREFAEGIATAFREVFVPIVTFLPQVIVRAIVGIGKAILDGIPKVVAWLVNLGAAIFNWALELPGKIAGFLIGLPSVLVNWVLDAAPELLYNLGLLLGTIVGWAIRIPVTLAGAFLMATDAIAGWVFDAIPKALSWLADFGLGIYGWAVELPEKIIGWLVDAGKSLWGWIEDTIPIVKARLSGIAIAFNEWAAGFIADAPGRLAALATNIWNWITTAVTDGPSRMAELLGVIIDWVAKTAPRIPKLLADLAVAIWDWITDTVAGLPDQIVELADDLLETGKAIIEGILEGLKEASHLITDWIGSFAGGFVKGFKDALGISSPSKVMRDLARHIPEGIALGIANGAKSISAEMDKAMMPINKLGGVRNEIGVDFGGSSLTSINAGSQNINQEYNFNVTVDGAGVTPEQAKTIGNQIADQAADRIKARVRTGVRAS